MQTKMAQDVIKYVAASSALTGRLLDEGRARSVREKAANDKAPAVLEALISSKLVPASQKTAAAEALQDHAKTLDLLHAAVVKAAKFRDDAQAQKTAASTDLGNPVNSKEAGVAGPSATPVLDPFVGRRTSQKKASDLALAQVLNPVR
jgi:hypothetical protein